MESVLRVMHLREKTVIPLTCQPGFRNQVVAPPPKLFTVFYVFFAVIFSKDLAGSLSKRPNLGVVL